MTPKGVMSELRDLLELLQLHEIARYSNPVVESRGKLNGVDVEVVSTIGWGDVLGRQRALDEFFSVAQYCSAVRNGNFSAILRDGSLLQMCYYFERREIVGHRLCYFPAPCEMDEGLLDDFGPADVVEMIMEQEPSSLRLRSPLRFDYSAFAPEAEPQCHLHLLFDGSRLPVFGPLSLGRFCGLVFQLFYPRVYESHRFLRELAVAALPRTIREAEERTMHLSCRHDPPAKAL
jgi:hypothetical protein